MPAPKLTLGRDPFARGTLRRIFFFLGDARYPATFTKECANCGGHTHLPGRPTHAAVFRLFWEDDQGSRHSGFLAPVAQSLQVNLSDNVDGYCTFCSMACARSYLG